MKPRWRTGHKLGRTLYQGDTLIGLIDTCEDATRIVQAVNEHECLRDIADLLRRLGEWDALNLPVVAPYGDGPYWKREIDRALARLDAAGTENT